MKNETASPFSGEEARVDPWRDETEPSKSETGSEAAGLHPTRFSDAWQQGLSVFPIPGRSKIPREAWKQYQKQRATLEQARAWDKTDCNVGIATGAVSNLFVLDCDSEEAFKEAQEKAFVGASVLVRTGKGYHCYYRLPDGQEIRNSAGKLGTGIDIRGEGGFVVGPGSIHPNGARYERL